MNKTVIGPVVGVVCLGVASIFHKEIPADVQDNVATLIVLAASVITSIWGIFKNHQSQ